MKLQILCFLTVTWSLSASALRCWTCENAKSPRECFKSGNSKQCSFLENVCQTEVRYSVGWGNVPNIRTGCKEQHACGNNHIQNPRGAWLPTQCNNQKYNSVCRCCCSGDHCNRKNLLCQTVVKEMEPSPQPLKDDSKTVARRFRSPEPMCARFPDAPKNGRRVCKRGKFIGSVCTFSCDAGYKQIGSRGTACVRRGKRTKWNRPSPACEKEPLCDDMLRAPKDGRMECHGGGELGTECLFACDDGRQMQGAPIIVCEKNESGIKWNYEAPQCLPPAPSCPTLGELRHGNVTCTEDSNGIGTKCQFECVDEGYSMLPNGRLETVCVKDNGKAKWSLRKPCCNAQCPPIAKKDIVIVIDSSRSISNPEWKIMKDFVTKVIGTFQVSEDAAQFAVFRFNGRVDTKSQVLFGDYTDVDELVRGVKNMPKRGGGTHLGKALRHARDYVLKHKNREDVDDIVWVLTDGKSKDKFKDVAEDLRDNGVEIIALGISRTGEEEFMDQLREMTGDKELVIEVTDVRESFSNVLVERVTSKICEISCE